MRTRTLLLLAVTCGLAILLAGGIQLLRLSNQKPQAALLVVGGTGKAGDAVVTVVDADTVGGAFVVTLDLSGVDDADGLDGFTLVGVGNVVKPLPPEGADACTGFTVEHVECTLTFPDDGFANEDRQLLFERAEDRVRWKLV
ncbi:MAG: hypothetical protein ABMA25_19390 [Ilumatobacteraceae bacterium]